MQQEGLRKLDALSEGKVIALITLFELKLLPGTGNLYVDLTNLLSKNEFAFTDDEIEYWLKWFKIPRPRT